MLVKADVTQSIIVCLYPVQFLLVQLPEGSQEELQKAFGHQGSFSWFHPCLPVACFVVVVAWGTGSIPQRQQLCSLKGHALIFKSNKKIIWGKEIYISWDIHWLEDGFGIGVLKVLMTDQFKETAYDWWLHRKSHEPVIGGVLGLIKVFKMNYLSTKFTCF